MTIRETKEQLIKEILAIRIAVNELTVVSGEEDKVNKLTEDLNSLQDKVFAM